jgi:hypothetical protein
MHVGCRTWHWCDQTVVWRAVLQCMHLYAMHPGQGWQAMAFTCAHGALQPQAYMLAAYASGVAHCATHGICWASNPVFVVTAAALHAGGRVTLLFCLLAKHDALSAVTLYCCWLFVRR